MNSSSNFLEYLNSKTLFYDKIDYKIINKSWDIISSKINLPYVIHIVGTNGKGSTGRYIASFLEQSNKNVIHYSSPHIIKFNERIWINGKDSSAEQLQFAHNKLQSYLDITLLDMLTYFEYTTLMAFILSSNKDYLILEAGLGGEFDATNVVENNLTVIPSIGIDHIEFLGNTIEKIATTKLKSCNNSYIFGLNMPNDIEKIRKDILNNKKQILINNNLKINREDIPIYLQNNLSLALSVIDYLGFNTLDLKLPKLFARFQKINNNITIDVGHNILAANVILKEYKYKKINLIYNSYKDKDYAGVLDILKPIINELEIINCKDDRILNINILSNTCDILNINHKIFEYKNMKKNTEYLVFGSFKVIEEFLIKKELYEK